MQEKDKYAAQRKWAASPRGKELRNANQRKKRQENPGYQREKVLKYKYGMTPEQYHQMLILNGNACAICFREGGKTHFTKLRIDHCHATGKVRGLLCHQCNAALGLLGDCIPIIKNAINYLRENNAPESGL